jgi:integrase
MKPIRLHDGSGARVYRFVCQETDHRGTVYTYFRRKGAVKIRLRSKPGTPEFDQEYRAAFNGSSSKSKPARVAVPERSFRWLVQRYYLAAAFTSLGETTRSVRRMLLDEICERAGDRHYATMEPRHIAKIRNEKADFPEAANARVKALRQFFAWACAPEYGYAQHNPARDVAYLRPKNPDGFHTWTEGEIDQYRQRHPIGTKARLALDLLLLTGVRKSDVVQLGRQMERDGALHFTEAKGRARKPKHRVIPILPELRASIEAAPWQHLTYVVTEFGKPFTVNGFGNWFKRRCREAGLEHCSAHGLRKAGATIAANSGATEHQLMVINGWESTKQASIYTRKADRDRLARIAMPMIAGRTE